MRRRIFIHIGTHKTGSTSIQSILLRNKDRLEQQGLIYVPLPEEIRSLIKRDPLSFDIIRIFRNYLNYYLTKHKQINDSVMQYVMSWEGFCGNAIRGYKNAGAMADLIKEVTHGLDVRIVIYLRRQDDFVESLYTQKIQEGNSYTFQEFLESIPTYNWERLLCDYADRFGKKILL